MSLRDLFPSGRFSLPATESAIASVEEQLGVRLPEKLRRLYFECDGFREDKGNAKYLLSLTEEDSIGSVLSTTKFMWTEVKRPDLKPFVFFGFSAGDEAWGIDSALPDRIIAYHHHMEDEFQLMDSDILGVFKSDYAIYERLKKKG
ncbi:MAG TPA: SMI1/KNR4 family protein [Lacunisphaera sp.]|nr:SMI1/KNR4 family protein [Lacunisphaera sp.]